MKNLFLLIPFFLLLSCKSTFMTMQHVNESKSFRNIEEYRNLVYEKYKLKSDCFYYATSEGYNDFLYEITKGKYDFFVGIFINDSIALKKTTFLLENESCFSRISNEIQNEKEIVDSGNVPNTLLKKFIFLNIASKKRLTFSDKRRKKIILLFSYKLGNLRKNDFEEVQKLATSTAKYDVIVLSLDNVANLEANRYK